LHLCAIITPTHGWNRALSSPSPLQRAAGVDRAARFSGLEPYQPDDSSSGEL